MSSTPPAKVRRVEGVVDAPQAVACAPTDAPDDPNAPRTYDDGMSPPERADSWDCWARDALCLRFVASPGTLQREAK